MGLLWFPEPLSHLQTGAIPLQQVASKLAINLVEKRPEEPTPVL